MTVNELIAELEAVRAEHGNIEVSRWHPCRCPGDDDMFDIEPTLWHWEHKTDSEGRKFRSLEKSGTPILML